MEQNQIKRVPVMYREKVAGIVTRTDLLRALINAAKPRLSSSDDATIRGQLLSHLAQQKWAPVGTIGVVRNGVGHVFRPALCTAAENIPGVKRVEDQLAWVVPGTGVMVAPVVITGSGK